MLNYLFLFCSVCKILGELQKKGHFVQSTSITNFYMAEHNSFACSSDRFLCVHVDDGLENEYDTD